MSDLKPLPCPFCGSAPQSVERPDNIDGTRFFYALACYCGGYSACAHKMAVEPTPEQAKSAAIEAWNRRAQPAQAGQVPITSETGNTPTQGASAITSESGKAGQVLTDESTILRLARESHQSLLLEGRGMELVSPQASVADWQEFCVRLTRAIEQAVMAKVGIVGEKGGA